MRIRLGIGGLFSGAFTSTSTSLEGNKPFGGSPVRNSPPGCHSLSPSTSSQRTFGANHIPILGILELNGRLTDMPRSPANKNPDSIHDTADTGLHIRSCLGIIGISWDFRV